MLHKLFMTFVVVPLGVLFVIFAVANRHAVTVSLDPFGSDAPALSATMPLFMLVLLLVGLGVVIGSVATWSRRLPTLSRRSSTGERRSSPGWTCRRTGTSRPRRRWCRPGRRMTVSLPSTPG